MTFLNIQQRLFIASAFMLVLYSCASDIPTEQPLIVKEDMTTVDERIKSIRENA